MELSLNLDARQVLFHLNYMGYRNITKEQLKSFMLDLKKLIRYESQPQRPPSTEVNLHAHASINIQRLFESHTENSKLKQREKVNKENRPAEKPKHQHLCRQKSGHLCRQKSDQDISKKNKDERPSSSQSKKVVGECDNQNKENNQKKQQKTSVDQNIPKQHKTTSDENKTKMWIRPKSAQSTRQISQKKRNDPVALYQEYQKDWERFKTNICESSRSELRWTIREKMLANH